MMKSKLLIFIVTGLSMINSPKLLSQMNTEELKELIAKAREKYNLPAVAVNLLSSDSVIASEVQGVRVFNSDKTVSKDDFFHIGSCSKSVLSFMAGALVDEGKINWQTSFFDLYPELKSLAHQEFHHITLEDLLLCKAGIKAYTSGGDTLPDINTEISKARYEFAKSLFMEKPAVKAQNGIFPFLYSNASYTLAAMMLEKASNLTYEQLIDWYILSKCGVSTFFGFPNKISEEQPWGHMLGNAAPEVFPPSHPYKLHDLLRPSGDISMTPAGFARYIQISLKALKGQNSVLSPETMKYIHYGHKGFSLGVGNGSMSGYLYSGMDGSLGTFFCRAIIVPDADFAFTIMTNAGSGTGQMKAIDWLTSKIVKKQFNQWWKFWE
jgi:CubicO group peptidase (beta-lactamase class C family)